MPHTTRSLRESGVAALPYSSRFRKPTRSFPAVIYTYFVAATLFSAPLLANGQAFLRNGQFFTKGLAISDAPFPGSPQHAGSNIVIAVELSGNGKIDQSAFIPGSGEPTRYDSLEIYLVSAQTGTNFTVSNGSELLTQEPGSTVKHLNWPLPSCVSPGVYNLTYYEASHISDNVFFSITPIRITVDNPNRSDDTSQCESQTNPLQDQPQPDSAPAINPYLDPGSGLNGSDSSNPDVLTITVGESGLPTQWTIEPSGSTMAGATGPVTTATVEVLSTATITETVTTGPTVFTTTSTGLVTTTITAIMGTGDVTAGGFFPVNRAMSDFELSLLGQLLCSCSVILITVFAFSI